MAGFVPICMRSTRLTATRSPRSGCPASTGIDLASATPAGELPAHIDVHPIPHNPAKGEPGDWHIDFRFVFRTTGDVGGLQTEEVDEAFWRSPGNLLDHELVRHITAALH
ncbi:hypothetical protein [Yinghuangia sp. YIM S09857]|uniref:hypothetical protein n=1 Tax=Yinghuangia sp. YIM S09857 TaxID=3436929 RepID=UPI003F535991